MRTPQFLLWTSVLAMFAAGAWLAWSSDRDDGRTLGFWLLFSGALVTGSTIAWKRCAAPKASVLAEVMLVIVLWIEGLFAWLTLTHDASAARDAANREIRLEINRQVQNFRLDRDVLELRHRIFEAAKQTDRDEQYMRMWTEGDLRWYLARLNNFCWVIEQCPAEEWANVTDVFDKVLVDEWHCLSTFIGRLRVEQHGENASTGWHYHNFQSVVAKLESKFGGSR